MIPVTGGKESNERVMVDYQYLIQSAVDKKLPWESLACFLTELAPTLDKSRKIIKILVQELEKWVTKVENDTSFSQPQFEYAESDITKVIQEDHMSSESSIISESGEDGNDDSVEISEEDQISFITDGEIEDENNLQNISDFDDDESIVDLTENAEEIQIKTSEQESMQTEEKEKPRKGILDKTESQMYADMVKNEDLKVSNTYLIGLGN